MSLSASSELAARGAGNTSARSVGAEMGNAEQSEMENSMNEQYGKYSGIYQGAPWWAFVFHLLVTGQICIPWFHSSLPFFPSPLQLLHPPTPLSLACPPALLLPAHPRGCISPAAWYFTSSLWLCFGGAFSQA